MLVKEGAIVFLGFLTSRSWLYLPPALVALTLGCSHTTSSTEPSVSANASAVVAGDPTPLVQKEALTQEALADLDRAGTFLGAQSRFSFRADVSYDVMQDDGLLLEFGGRREIAVRRPDRVRFETTDRSGATKTLTFDGKTIFVENDLAG